MFRRLALLLFVAVTLDSAAAHAQSSTRELPVLARGSRVRLLLSADEGRRTGRSLVSGLLVSGDSARVVIMRRDGLRADTIPTFTIDDVELYTGERSRRSMIIGGALAGAGASGLIYAVDRFSRGHRCGSSADCPPLLPAGYYAIPVTVGAVFGATFSASRWIAVPRNTVNIGVRDMRSLELAAMIHFQ